MVVWLGPFCMELAFLRGFSLDTQASSHSPKHAHNGVRLIGESQLPLRVNVSEWMSISLCYPCRLSDWQPLQGVPRLSPHGSQDRLSKLIKQCLIVKDPLASK